MTSYKQRIEYIAQSLLSASILSERFGPNDKYKKNIAIINEATTQLLALMDESLREIEKYANDWQYEGEFDEPVLALIDLNEFIEEIRVTLQTNDNANK